MNESTRRELMEQALHQTSEYGKELARTCRTVSDYFHRGQTQEGTLLLRQFLQGIGSLSRALEMTRPLQVERDLSIDLSQLSGVLEPLVRALENQDYVLIGDILVYELEPVLKDWSGKLEFGPEQRAAAPS